MPWGVSTADVLSTTGASATSAQVAQADGVITIYVNRTSDASAAISPRDLGWIKTAIAWQTPWQAGQPGFTTRMQFDTLTQDGLAVEARAEWAKILAPMAARALKNLSWKGTGTLRTPNINVPVGMGSDFLLESSDVYGHWEPL